ncbi:protein of unknown function [Nocardioides alpinus]|uniref:DUF4082 domain-containing protein n=1 Tax=Nocardioides alpinus TaxID=748909 RepID=A0A1I0VSK4_9ACTN|nr:DUF4082 domain-containing protein [Nocardioides alpinus]PKH37434.1 DUF4082 domain-containing protein [Nocardioides alpinus]SFA78997.1 protein of unknown function [Nocardioides alpinus]
MSTSPRSMSACSRALAAPLALVLTAALVLAGAAVAPASSQPADAEPTAWATAEELGLFATSKPRQVTKVRNRRPTEVGLQFVATSAGSVTGVEVYKVARASGATPRRASLWNARGERLATAKIAPHAGKGWVTVRFTSPVEVLANRTYTVSAFAPKGRYAMTARGLRKSRVRGVLQTGGERVGVRRHGGTSGFPKKAWRKSNYWVDVLFVPAPVITDPPEPTPTGWPNADNTGVPAGTALTPYTGPLTIQTPGTVIDAKQVDGSLRILAPDVTISRSSISGNVSIEEDASLTITDTDINAGDRAGTGLEAYNFTATRVHVVGGSRSMSCAKNCTIRDSYVHGQMTDETGVHHESGIRMEQNTTLIHNTITCDAPNVPPDAGCSAGLTGYGDFAPVRDNLIQNNLFLPSTGGTCAYGGASGGKPYSDATANIRFIDNVFTRGSGGKCGYWWPITDFDGNAPGNVWSGNVWDDGTPVSPS